MIKIIDSDGTEMVRLLEPISLTDYLPGDEDYTLHCPRCWEGDDALTMQTAKVVKDNLFIEFKCGNCKVTPVLIFSQEMPDCIQVGWVEDYESR